MARLSGRIKAQLDNSGAIVPIGTIVACMNGYFMGVGNDTFQPGSAANSVAGMNAWLPDNWRVCNGSAPNDPDSPIFNAPDRYLPELVGSRFVMGFMTAGTAGGANSITLTEGQLPAHTHTINHGHANSFALGNATVASSSHRHDFAHAHQWGWINGADTSFARIYTRTTLSDSATSISSSDVQLMGKSAVATGSGQQRYAESISSNQNLYTAGVLSPPNGSGGSSANTGTPNATTTVTLSGSVTSHTGSSGSAGSGNAFSILPQYVTAFYIMRIK